jgi:transposase
MQYGLVAEEVAKVYPELVIRDEAGNIQGVRYDELASMLLNEMQRLSARVAALDKLEQEMHGQELHDTPQIEIR